MTTRIESFSESLPVPRSQPCQACGDTLGNRPALVALNCATADRRKIAEVGAPGTNIPPSSYVSKAEPASIEVASNAEECLTEPIVLRGERWSAVQGERRRLANELHDIVSNHLNSVSLLLAAARLSLKGEERSLIEAAGKGVRDCWTEIRRCVTGLRPQALDNHDIASALSIYARRISSGSNVSVTFFSCGNFRELPGHIELALLRISQEAVTNALRHAHATAVTIELTYGTAGVGLKVSDNGVGFNVAKASEGIGLWSIRDRALSIGGELAILSPPGNGTQVILTIASGTLNRGEPETYFG
jgi:signal transduction histidine kinase